MFCGRSLRRCFLGWCFSRRHRFKKSVETSAPVRVRIGDVRLAGLGLWRGFLVHLPRLFLYPPTHNVQKHINSFPNFAYLTSVLVR